MAKAKTEVIICDICDKETKGFYYWENTNSPLGVIGEYSLIIDICEHCAEEIKFDIPKNMMVERSGSDTVSEEEVKEQIEEWKRSILGN